MLLVGVVVGFVVATALVIGVPAYVASRSAVLELAGQVMDQASARTDAEIQSLLGDAATQSDLTERLLRTGQLPVDDCGKMTTYFLTAMRVLPRLSYLSLTRDQDGLHCEVMRERGEDLFVRWLVREPDGRLSLNDFTPMGPALVPTFRAEDRPENDARARPWYLAARDRKAPGWTETYVFIGESGGLDVPGVTYATPLYDVDDKLLGALTADFDLLSLSAFLGQIRVLDHGFSFVLEYRADGTRRVVAHPTPEILTAVMPEGGHEARRVEDLSDARVRSFVAELPPVFADLPAASRFRFESDGAAYFGAWRQVEGRPGLHWLVCTVVPESDVLGGVHRSLRVQALLGLLTVAFGLVLAAWVASVLARPLRSLVMETREIGKFRLDARTRSPATVDEVRQLEAGLEHMKASLRSFRKYVPDDLVRNLLASGQEARLGGRRATLTIFFTDLAGFTSLAESMAPEQLVAILGEYLDAMTGEIQGGGGTVDKYIGDAVMAFWGAPEPRADHAIAACRAALAGKARLASLANSWTERGLPALSARIGLNTGEAIVGNLGSETRLDYTAIGDAVNLASRFEGLNKEYCTTILIGEATYNEVCEVVVARPIDRVAVKGRKEGLLVYELLAMRAQAAGDIVERAQGHSEAFDAYVSRRFDDAAARLRVHLARWPADEPARNLLQRCEAYLRVPPPADWDGVFRMTTK